MRSPLLQERGEEINIGEIENCGESINTSKYSHRPSKLIVVGWMRRTFFMTGQTDARKYSPSSIWAIHLSVFSIKPPVCQSI